MLIIPAIDIRKGKVVRLVRGDFEKETVYSNNPTDIALKWQKDGAQMLHIVDLDGALTGELQNIDYIAKIIKTVNIPIEVGGGIRNYEDIERFIKMKTARVILSTAACEDKELLKRALLNFKEKIAVSLDVKDDKIMTRGWRETSGLNVLEFAKELKELGLKTVIFTDVESDGTLKGTRVEKIRNFLMGTDLSVIASGGISSLEDIEKLKKLQKYGLEGIIIGKALYDNKISLRDALKVL